MQPPAPLSLALQAACLTPPAPGPGRALLSPAWSREDADTPSAASDSETASLPLIPAPLPPQATVCQAPWPSWSPNSSLEAGLAQAVSPRRVGSTGRWRGLGRKSGNVHISLLRAPWRCLHRQGHRPPPRRLAPPAQPGSRGCALGSFWSYMGHSPGEPPSALTGRATRPGEAPAVSWPSCSRTPASTAQPRCPGGGQGQISSERKQSTWFHRCHRSQDADTRTEANDTHT